MTKDSLIVITPLQLRQTNLIFLEHSKLKLELKELSIQVQSYNNMVESFKQIENDRKVQIDSLRNGYLESQLIIQKNSLLIDKQKNKLKRTKRVAIGGVTISVALLTFLLIQK